MTTLTERQRAARRYQFRSIVALWDIESPHLFVLSWNEARRAWRQATNIAAAQRT